MAETVDPRHTFRRLPSVFRDHVSSDGSTPFPAATGRYVLYVSLACPWAHRAVIVRHRKALEKIIPMRIVDPIRDDRGWAFTGAPGTDRDDIEGFELLAEAYVRSDPQYAGRVTVPVLWDRETGAIVSNESSEIIRMLNSAFDAFTDVRDDLYPSDLAAEIDATNARVYDDVNNGVYRSGFAVSQAAYEEACTQLFATLEWLGDHLATRRHLVGDRLTEADVRLFTTLVRFDAVYHGHFKCNRWKIAEHPVLSAYLRDHFALAGFGDTTDFDQIKRHYYVTHAGINPTRIVPIGPDLRM